jgi:phosphoglycerol transferase MdoB-like AlkP superfamily enzyme
MIDRPEPNRLQSFGRTVNLAFFFVLLLIMGTVIYGLILRAVWEDSYYTAVGIAVLGAIVLLIGLAQQEIAARDKATWRAMAEWQLRHVQQVDRALGRAGEGRPACPRH